MTKKEAIELENKCDELMSRYLNKYCNVSMALNGRLKVSFDDNYITLTKDISTAWYVKFNGFYLELEEYIDSIIKCVKDNVDIFNELMWSYEHISEITE
jgi:hypothetical protein